MQPSGADKRLSAQISPEERALLDGLHKDVPGNEHQIASAQTTPEERALLDALSKCLHSNTIEQSPFQHQIGH